VPIVALSYAPLAYGFAYRRAEPVDALAALRRGLEIARDSGIRANESYLAINLARLEVDHGDHVAALDYLALAIRNNHDSSNTPGLRSPLAVLATFLHRLGRHEPAATIAGYAVAPLTTAALPEFKAAIVGLRGVLGEQIYESFTRKGKAMTSATVATYAYDQIDQARTELEQCRNR
jgi:hypothetical protein